MDYNLELETTPVVLAEWWAVGIEDGQAFSIITLGAQVSMVQ